MKYAFTAAAAAVICAAAFAGCGREPADTAEPSPAETVSFEAEPTIDAENAVSSEVFETPVDKNELLGSWVNDENSVSIRFNSDGTYINDPIEGHYTLSGNTLTLTYDSGDVSEDYLAGFRSGQLVLVRGDMQLIFDRSE